MQPIDLSSELPPRRDDEPSSLRADIFDELLDHLECSYQRERVKTSDETIAQRNVLAKFGNPASIAFRLWRDAMWEKLVMQKITTIASSLIAVVAVFACGMLWSELRESRLAQMTELAELRTAFSSLTAEIRSQPKPVEESKWSDVTVKLVREDGTPTQGKVTLMVPGGTVAQPDQGPPPPVSSGVEAEADSQGIAKLRSVPYERYELKVELESPRATAVKPVYFRPGMEEVKVVCPNVPQKLDFQVQLEPPERLRHAPFRYIVTMQNGGIIHVDNVKWQQNSVEAAAVGFDSNGTSLGVLAGQPVRSSMHGRYFTVGNSKTAVSTVSFNRGIVAYELHVAVQFVSTGALTINYPEDALFPAMVEGLSDPYRTFKLTPGSQELRIGPDHEFWEGVSRMAVENKLHIGSTSAFLNEDGHYYDQLTPRYVGDQLASTLSHKLWSELRRGDTQMALRLSEEQRQKLSAIFRSQPEDAFVRVSGGARRGGNQTSEEDRIRLEAASSDSERLAINREIQRRMHLPEIELDRQILSVLTPEQTRLVQSIRIQRKGPAILVGDFPLADAVGVTPEQAFEFTRVYGEQRGIGRGGVQPTANTQRLESLLDLLTPEQRAKWDELKGPPLTFDRAGYLALEQSIGNPAP